MGVNPKSKIANPKLAAGPFLRQGRLRPALQRAENVGAGHTRLDDSNPKSKIQNLKSTTPALQRAINLLPYQRHWVEDDSKLKIAVKARQIGYSFAATLRAVFKCLERRTTWIFLSKGERQSRLLMEKVQEHVQTCGIVARASESQYFEGTSLKQLEVRFPNGSVIYGLPANPDTARGYTGHVTLDEFAFHADADKIYAALFPTITRGFGIEVISTPNGTQGKFYELAKSAGLTEAGLGIRSSGFGPSPLAPLPAGEGKRRLENIPLPRGEGGPAQRGRVRVPSPQHPAPSTWSPHYCDVYDAARQGLQIDIALLRSGCEDESSWQQEFCCQFVSSVENFFSPELLAACLSAEAGTDMTPSLPTASARGTVSGPGARGSGLGRELAGLGTNCDSSPLPAGEGVPQGGTGEGAIFPSHESRFPSPEYFLGIDIGRRHDRTVFWVDELRVLGTGDWGLGSMQPSTQNPEPGTGDRVAVARLVRTMENTPFDEQLRYARELLSLTVGAGLASPLGAQQAAPLLIRRCCIDATGIGAMLAETLEKEFGPRVEPVIFTAAVKENLAFRTRRRMEARLTLLPDTREIRRAFSAVKKFVTPSGNIRFDAARTEAGHSDEFWAKALADLAADPDARQAASRLSDAFMADAAPLVAPAAFGQIDSHWSAFAW